jgi:hypothetical protein
MVTSLKTGVLRPSKAPNLPIAPVEYTQQYQDQVLNALRLYFNQIDNFGFGLSNPQGGSYLSFPCIAADYYPAQYASADNTATIVAWNNASKVSGFTLNSDNTATATYSGTYKITYSLQFANSDNAAHDAVVWLKVNGIDVPSSTTIFTVQARKSAGIYTYVCGYSEVVFDLNAGDKVGLWWGTDQHATSGGALGLWMYSRAAQTTPMAYPATPSAIGSITFVSALS